MGKNYSTDSYKRSYSNEYVKSYKYSHIEQPALKNEPTSNTVRAEGIQKPKKVTPPSTKPKAEAVTKTEGVIVDKTQKNKKELIIEPFVIKPKEELPPPYTTTKKVDIQTEKELPPSAESLTYEKTEIEDKFGLDSPKYPIEHLHGNSYRNIVTLEEIDEEQARKLLIADGFNPKKPYNTLVVAAITIAIVWLFGFFGIFIAIAIGAKLYQKNDIAYEKFTSFGKLSYLMPPTYDQEMAHKAQGMICIIIAIIGGVIKFIQ